MHHKDEQFIPTLNDYDYFIKKLDDSQQQSLYYALRDIMLQCTHAMLEIPAAKRDNAAATHISGQLALINKLYDNLVVDIKMRRDH